MTTPPLDTCLALLEHLPGQCFTAVGLDMRYTYAAGPLLLVFEFTAADIIGKHPDEIAPGISAHYALALQGHDVTVPDREFRGHSLEQVVFPLYPRNGGPIIGAASAIRDVTHRVLGLRYQEQLATTDALTGIANLRAFEKRLERGLRGPCSILVLDLNGMKRWNDTKGHESGNDMLRAVAGMLTSCVRPQDVVARTGGDEFSILLLNAEATEAFSVSTRIRLAVSSAVGEISVSVGAATFPDDGTDPRALRELADRRMYVAKRGR